MRKMVVAVLVAALAGALPHALTADEPMATIRVGGGAFYNVKAAASKGYPGAHIALDLRLPDKNILISPFGDYYWKSGATVALGGVHAFAKPPMRSDLVSLYFGAGAGMIRMTKFRTTVVDTINGKPTPREVFKNRTLKLIDLVGGLEVKMTRTISIFFEPRYVRGDSTLTGVSGHAGLSFHMM